MKNLSKKTKFRVTILIIGFIISIGVLLSVSISYWTQINNNKKEMKELEKTYNNKLAEEEDLKDEINKLQDPEYMARYTREKYLYSKDDEIVIKIEN